MSAGLRRIVGLVVLTAFVAGWAAPIASSGSCPPNSTTSTAALETHHHQDGSSHSTHDKRQHPPPDCHCVGHICCFAITLTPRGAQITANLAPAIRRAIPPRVWLITSPSFDHVLPFAQAPPASGPIG